ncbi:STM3941 family protein [Sphingobacterium lactis]|uniref:Uncharacterized protein n=1 Tax=Sphingobacterium lactis TaxID=797291 RepID=A0A1H6BRR2_9SPHI|nr:STM3941 family protein [Sphingobacterium lactis]SEG63322.1 hypothetical protein SAMN05421877_11186 [Sphingobacterium lactis]
MESFEFKYGKGQQQKIALFFLVIGIVGLVFIYYVYFVDTRALIMWKVTSVFLALLGFGAFLKLILAPKDPNEVALRIDAQGITGKTTPVAKAAGLIDWEDITHIDHSGNMMFVQVINPEKYAQRMKNFFVKDTFMKTNKGYINFSLMELNATEAEIHSAITKFYN